MINLLVATQNKGKLREYQRLLTDYTLLSPADAGLADFDVEESGATFAENAILKARAYSQASGLITLADDSGLAVDALDGRPGVYSARYGGPGLGDAQRRAALLAEMEGIPIERRTARFVCVIAVVHPDYEAVIQAEGHVEGRILIAERGFEGFGYDPLFQPDGHQHTFGELSAEIKDSLSHRGRAVDALRPLLADLLRPR
jgi:XTP/dITP diphosphohydrolase